MKTKYSQQIAAAVCALACMETVQAHHSISMFDISTPIWVKGTVIRYEPIAPHAMIELEATTEDGQVQRWTVEGPFPGRLNRILSANGLAADAALVKAGDVIEVCGFDLREDLRAKRPPSAADGSSPVFVHGHVIVMPDGHMQSWGPYGKTDNCVRRNDDEQSWEEFLNRDPLARDLWCNSKVYVRATSVTSDEFIDEVSRQISDPCP